MSSHLLYTTLMLLASMFGAIKSFLLARVMRKSAYGLYSLTVVAATYLNYLLSAGVSDGFLREGSLATGRKETGSIERLNNNAAFFALLMVLTLGTLVTAVAWWLLPLPPNVRAAIAYAPALAFALVQYNLLATQLRVSQRLVTYACFLLVKNSLAAVSTTLVAVHFTFVHVVAVEVAVLLIFAAPVYLRRISFEQPISRRVADIRRMIRVGMPLTANNLLKNVTLSVDRWFVAVALGTVALGEYAFAMLTLTLVLALLNILTLSLGPRWIASYGETSNKQRLFSSIAQTSRVLSLIGLAAAPLLYLGLPLLLRMAYPQYADQGSLVLVVYVGVTLHAINLFEWFFIATGHGVVLVRISALVLVSLFALCVVAAQFALSPIHFALLFVLGRGLALALTFGKAAAVRELSQEGSGAC